MAKTETNVSTLKINRGTYANIQANLSNIGENELIITEDKNVPIPTASDVGKAPIINASGEYEFGSVGTDVVANPTLAGTEANLTSIKIAGTNYNVPDTTYTSKSAVSGGTDVSLVTTGEKYTWNNKQNALPNVINDRYLHTNVSTGALEWTQVQSGDSIFSISLSGSSGTISTDVSTIANHLVNDKQIQIITQDEPIATITLMADKTSVSHPEDNDYTVVIFSSMDNGAKPEFIQWTFEFNLTDSTPTITWERTFSVKIPVSDSGDAGKVLSVNNNGNYALVQPSTPNAFHIDVTSQGMSGTITTDVENVATHMKNDDLLWINGFVCSLASRMVVSDEYFMAIYTADYYDTTDFGQVSFYFVCTAYASGITFTETITKIPLPTTNDSGKVISVDSTGRFVLTQQSSGGSLYSLTLGTGASGTISMSVSEVLQHLREDNEIIIDGHRADVTTRTYTDASNYSISFSYTYTISARTWFYSYTFVPSSGDIAWSRDNRSQLPASTTYYDHYILGINTSGNYARMTNAYIYYPLTLTGSSGTISSDVETVARYLTDSKQIMINNYIAERVSVETVSNVTTVKYSIVNAESLLNFQEYSFAFDLTAASPTITWTKVYDKSVPSPTSADANKILTVNAQGEYVLDSITNLADVYNGQVV